VPPGYERLRTVVSMHSMRYNAATLRKEKTAITQEIVEIIQTSGDPPGRFIQLDQEADWRVQVEDEVARRKVGHSIRYYSRHKKRKATPETLEASVQEASTLRSDTLHRDTAYSGDHQERLGDRSPLVSDGDILARLGFSLHSTTEHDDDPVPWKLSPALDEYMQALEACVARQHHNIVCLPPTSSSDNKAAGIV
jgi:hypothetical protein